MSLTTPVKPSLSQRFRQHSVSFFFFLLSAACFGIFARNAYLAQSLSGTSSLVGYLVDGEASRKRHGDKEFYPIVVPTKIHNLDSLWVGKNQSADVRLEDGTKLEVKENSLVVFKRPFSSSSSMSDKVIVLKGSVRVAGSGAVLTDQSAGDRMKEVPKKRAVDTRTEAQKKEDEEKVFPKPDSLVYYVLKKNSESSSGFRMTFTWPKHATGHLVIQDSTSSRVRYIPIKEANYTDIDVSLERSYVWQVVDQEKSLTAGPYSFEVHKVLKKEMDNVLGSGLKAASQRPVQIRFEE
jgi:hypothetical protein